MTTHPSLDLSSLRLRPAATSDGPRLIPLINSAFSVETFFDGTRTDETRLAAMMNKGTIFLAEESTGRLLGCVYTEVRGARGYIGQLAVAPQHQRAGLGASSLRLPRIISADRAAKPWTSPSSVSAPNFHPFTGDSVTSNRALKSSTPPSRSNPASNATAS